MSFVDPHRHGHIRLVAEVEYACAQDFFVHVGGFPWCARTVRILVVYFVEAEAVSGTQTLISHL